VTAQVTDRTAARWSVEKLAPADLEKC